METACQNPDHLPQVLLDYLHSQSIPTHSTTLPKPYLPQTCFHAGLELLTSCHVHSLFVIGKSNWDSAPGSHHPHTNIQLLCVLYQLLSSTLNSYYLDWWPLHHLLVHNILCTLVWFHSILNSQFQLPRDKLEWKTHSTLHVKLLTMLGIPQTSNLINKICLQYYEFYFFNQKIH